MSELASCADEAVRQETSAQMDAIVQQIFTVMTGTECFPVDTPAASPPDLHARVVFLRSCCKTCDISLTHEDADVLIRLLMGVDNEDHREDVAGELCNMIAGGWKSQRSVEDRLIGMSTPEIAAHNGAEFCAGCSTCFCGTYGFGSAQFTVRLRCADTH